VRAFFAEWLEATRPSLKATTYASYRNMAEFYIYPILGNRWLSEVNVRTLNAFYRHLLDQGRIRSDTNTALYALWLSRREERGGYGPLPSELAAVCGTTKEAARQAVIRFRRGRVPTALASGLSVKSVKNVHGLIRRAFRDAVAWEYLISNPAVHAVLPRARSGRPVQRHALWSVEQLGRWLTLAMTDRYDGLWVLAATTGMRRSELAGVRRSLLDLDAGTLILEDTRVVVDGRAEDSDGKSAAGRRAIALDPYTVKHLACYVAKLDDEAAAHGRSAPYEFLAVGPTGERVHPDTLTRRFNRLVDRAGVPRIRLHDVRHTYVTMAMDAGVNPKLLSDRIGHANELVTLQIYTHRTTGLDRPMAEQLSRLIEGAVEAASRAEDDS
jgi:integrase